MTFKEKVALQIDKALLEYPSLFLIEFSIADSNKISVVLDGDTGVNLQDCINVNKAIDEGLDREEEDFSLEVASAGVSSPLKLVRQYKKNIGRNLKVKTLSQGEIEAKLVEVSEETITLNWKAREPKEIGKGKVTVEKTVTILFSGIKESIVVISF